jgi:hypothetical protein
MEFVPSPEQPLVFTFRKGRDKTSPQVAFFPLDGGQQIRGMQASTVVFRRLFIGIQKKQSEPW